MLFKRKKTRLHLLSMAQNQTDVYNRLYYIKAKLCVADPISTIHKKILGKFKKDYN